MRRYVGLLRYMAPNVPSTPTAVVSAELEKAQAQKHVSVYLVRSLASRWDVSGVMSGSLRTSETRSHIAASSKVLLHPGMALILIPCLIVQNVFCASSTSA